MFSRSGRRRTQGRPVIRRSSTNRSIGNRSDFNSTIAGDATPAASTVLDDEDSSRPLSRRDSSTALPQNGDSDEHLHNYVESQLQRVRSSASIVEGYEDELETQADKQNGDY
jgi:hypothetical protein